jgi:hypothetical protein
MKFYEVVVHLDQVYDQISVNLIQSSEYVLLFIFWHATMVVVVGLALACIAAQLAFSLVIVWSLQFGVYLWLRTPFGFPHDRISGILWPLPAKWRDRLGAMTL